MIKYYLNLSKKNNERKLLFIKQKNKETIIGPCFNFPRFNIHTSYHKSGSLRLSIYDKTFTQKNLKIVNEEIRKLQLPINHIYEGFFTNETFKFLKTNNGNSNKFVINIDHLKKDHKLQINILSSEKNLLDFFLVNTKKMPDFILNGTDPVIMIYFHFVSKPWKGET